MKKTLLAILGVLCAATIGLSVLSACGGGGDPKDDPPRKRRQTLLTRQTLPTLKTPKTPARILPNLYMKKCLQTAAQPFLPTI